MIALWLGLILFLAGRCRRWIASALGDPIGSDACALFLLVASAAPAAQAAPPRVFLCTCALLELLPLLLLLLRLPLLVLLVGVPSPAPPLAPPTGLESSLVDRGEGSNRALKK